MSVETRFWAKVKKTDTCWEWVGKPCREGYGRIQSDDKRELYTHKFVWTLYRGTIPDCKIVSHKCKNRLCCNPEHLYLRGITLEDRFWEKVDKSGECWVWTASCRHNGYGLLMVSGKRKAAHRLAWELTYGFIPAGMYICHKCDNPPCVRPDHLFVGTAKDNVHDCRAKGRLVPPPPNTTKGEAHPTAKLTEEQAQDIIEQRLTCKMTVKQLAEKYNIHPATVDKIVKGDRWKHLERKKT